MGTSHRQASDGLGHDSFGDDRSDSLEEITANLLRQSVATCRQETLAENHATLLAANIVTAAHRLVSQHGRDAITDATVNDLIAMILRVTPLRPPEAGFIVHMVFSLMQPGRQLSGRLVDRMSREIDDIENMGEFYLVFENLVRELVIDLL